MIENFMFFGVEMGGRHFPCDCHTHGIAYSLPEWASRAFNPGGFHVFRMTGGLAVQLAKIPDFLHGEIKSGKMKPSVKEHTPMPGRQDKAVAIDPLGIGWIDLQVVTKKNGPDFGGSEGESQVSGRTGMNGVDGQPAGLIGGPFKNFLILHNSQVRLGSCND